MNEIILGGGCFWCLEAAYQLLKGVESVQCGYAGGTKETATYKEVCSGQTNHAEVVKITVTISQIGLAPITTVLNTHPWCSDRRITIFSL